MASSGMLRRVALVKTDVSEELSTSIIRVTRIGELGTALAITATDAHCKEILYIVFLCSMHGLLLWLTLFLVHRFLSL
jgi:hypothetical protein